MKQEPFIPDATRSMQKGSSLRELLSHDAITYLARNIRLVNSSFPVDSFIRSAKDGLQPLGLLERGHHIVNALRQHLPDRYNRAVLVLIDSLTPPLQRTDDLGLKVFF